MELLGSTMAFIDGNKRIAFTATMYSCDATVSISRWTGKMDILLSTAR